MEKCVCDLKALLVAAGSIWGGYLFLAVLLESANIQFLMFNSNAFSLLQRVYPGISVSIGGALLALVWGFLCAGIAFALGGWIYNKVRAATP